VKKQKEGAELPDFVLCAEYALCILRFAAWNGLSGPVGGESKDEESKAEKKRDKSERWSLPVVRSLFCLTVPVN
jgi:hypothetical protein